MSAILEPVSRWRVKCSQMRAYVSDFGAQSVTLTVNRERAERFEHAGAHRVVDALSKTYPAVNWIAVAEAEG